MKYFLSILLLSLSIFCCSNAQGDPGISSYEVFEQQGKMGLKDTNGNILIPASYDKIGWSKGGLELVGNVVGYKINDNWGLVSIDNNLITSAHFTQLYPGTSSLIIASKKGKLSQRDFLGVITTTGAEVIPHKYASLDIEGLRAIVGVKYGRHYEYGLVDLSDKNIIPLKFKSIEQLGNLRFAVKNFENKVAIFNDEGKQVIDFQLDSISAFNHGYAVIYDNHQLGLINTAGEIVLKPDLKDIIVTDIEIIKESFNEWSIVNAKHDKFKTIYCDELVPFNNSLLQINANNHSWLIDHTGAIKTNTSNDYLGPATNGLIPFSLRSQWGVMTVDGVQIITPVYDSVIISNDLIFVKEKRSEIHWKIYDLSGKRKSDYFYQEIDQSTEGLYPVKKYGHWGFVNRDGDEIIHCVYEEVGKFIFGKVAVKFHGKYGIIDQNSDWVVLPQATKPTIVSNEYYTTMDGELFRLYSFEDGLIYFTENKVLLEEGYLLEYTTNGTIWRVDFSGQILDHKTDEKYEEIRKPSEGLYPIKRDGRYGFIDAQNRLLIANRYEDVGNFKDGLAAFKILGKWGFINKSEEIVIQPSYHEVSEFNNGLAVAKNDEGYGLINTSGDKISSFSYSHMYLKGSDRYYVRSDGKIGLLNRQGRVMLNPKFDAIDDLGNGYIIVEKSGKFGLVDYNGVNTIPLVYDQLVFDRVNDKFLVMKKSVSEKVELQ